MFGSWAAARTAAQASGIVQHGKRGEGWPTDRGLGHLRPGAARDGLGFPARSGDWKAEFRADTLRFCKLRAASFVNYGIFNRVFDSQVLTDFAFIEHSLALSPAGCDA